MSQLESQMLALSNLITQKISDFDSIERESKEKIESMERRIIQSENDKQDLLNLIQALEEKINELEEKTWIKPILGSISAHVESNQMIRGAINLVGENTKLDTEKSIAIFSCQVYLMLKISL